MKARMTTAWILCFLCVSVVGAGANTLLPSLTESTFHLDLPTDLTELARRALGASPQLEELERGLKIAQSRYRVGIATAQGSSLSFEAPIHADEKRVRGGTVLSLRHRAGDVTTEAKVGAAARLRAYDDWMVGPTLAVGVSYSLGSRHTVDTLKNEYQRAVAEQAYVQGTRAWTRQLVEAYSVLQLARWDVEIATQRRALAQAKLKAMLDRQSEGAATNMDVYLARHEVTQRHAEADQAQLAADLATDRLRRITGVPLEPTEKDLTQVRVSIQSVPGDDDEGAWLATALEWRADYRIAKLAVELAQAELNRADRASGLNGELQAGISYPSDVDATDPKWAWYIGAGFVLPLHDLPVTEAIYQASLGLEQAQADQELLLERIRSEVRIAFRRARLAIHQIDRVAEEVSHAGDLVEMASDASVAGLGTEWDVAEAMIRLAEAEREAVKVYFDAVLARINLWHLAGRDVVW